MKILISWAGIAWLTCAYRLERFGFSPVVVEKSKELRDEWYMINFAGEGLQISHAMWIFEQLQKRSEFFKGIDVIDDTWNKIGGFDMQMIKEFMHSKWHTYMSISRWDLERSLFESLWDSVEIRFDEYITSLENNSEAVNVSFSSWRKERYDILIWADGIHSSTRAMIWWDENQFLKPFGSKVLITRLSRQGSIWEYNQRGRVHFAWWRFLFVVPTNNEDLLVVAAVQTDRSIDDIRANTYDFMKEHFDENPFGSSVLRAMTTETYTYVDDVAQIVMDSWSCGRVSLIWDAASSHSLLAGQWTHMAMTQAYVLAHQISLHRTDHTQAFSGYEQTLFDLVFERRKRAKELESRFIPKTRWQIKLSYLVFRLMKYQWMIRLALWKYTTPNLFDKGYPLVGRKK